MVAYSISALIGPTPSSHEFAADRMSLRQTLNFFSHHLDISAQLPQPGVHAVQCWPIQIGQLVLTVLKDLWYCLHERRKAFRDDDAELHQQATQVVRERRALLDQQLARTMDRLQALLLDRLHRCFLDLRSASGFCNGQGIIAIGLVSLPERRHGLGGNDARFVPVPLRGTRPVVRCRARLEGNKRWLLLTQKLRELLTRQRAVAKLFAPTGNDRDLDNVLC